MSPTLKLLVLPLRTCACAAAALSGALFFRSYIAGINELADLGVLGNVAGRLQQSDAKAGRFARGARHWLRHHLDLKLVLANTSFQLTVGSRTTTVILGLHRNGTPRSACSNLASSLDFWATLVSAEESTDNQVVESAVVERVPDECAWQVMFTPSQSRNYDLHVRSVWWNSSGAEPAWSTAEVQEGWCHTGDPLVRENGTLMEGLRVMRLSGIGSGEKLCSDICTSDERCQFFDYNYTENFQETICATYPSSSAAVRGPCRSGHPKTDRHSWSYLGGWSILNHPLKIDWLHAQSHVYGSPAALGMAVRPAEDHSEMPVSERGKHLLPKCSSGRERGIMHLTVNSSQWEPLECQLPSYTSESVAKCFEHRNITEILLAGDSLCREQFIELMEIREPNSPKNEMKIHHGQFQWLRPDGVNTTIRLGGLPGFRLQSAIEEIRADVFVTNLEAHWLMWFESRVRVGVLLHELSGALLEAPQNHKRIYLSGVYPHSMRQSYIFPSRMEYLNKKAEEILGPKGFRVLDVYNMSRLQGNLSYDGMHLGLGASAVTPVLLSMICEDDTQHQTYRNV